LREKIYNECVIACIDASLVEQKFFFLSDSIKVWTWITRFFSLIFSRMNNVDGKMFMKNQYKVHF